jgi:hypothetical protein
MILALGVVAIVVIAGVYVWWTAKQGGGGNGGGNQGEDDLSLYKGIPSARIPGNCLGARNDACELFACMVSQCFCLESPNKVLFKTPAGVLAESEDEAKNAVTSFLVSAPGSAEYAGFAVKRAVKLNAVFWNVFAEDASGNEKTFTVAADGTIIKTVCNV